MGNSAFHVGKHAYEEKEDCTIKVVHYCSKDLEFCLHHCQRGCVTFNKSFNTKGIISCAFPIYLLLSLHEWVTATEINAF